MNIRNVRKRKAIFSYHKRTGISPVLATVILIAITLVAGVAIAGFAFGLFGTLSGGANVQVQVTSCKSATGICSLTLTNSGNAPAAPSGCAIYGTPLATGKFTTTSVAAGTSQPETCTGTTGSPVGSTVSGSITMTNGVTIPWSGTWS